MNIGDRVLVGSQSGKSWRIVADDGSGKYRAIRSGAAPIEISQADVTAYVSRVRRGDGREAVVTVPTTAGEKLGLKQAERLATGGRRRGAGAPKKFEQATLISLRLPARVIRAIDRLKRERESRGEAILRLLARQSPLVRMAWEASERARVAERSD